MHDTLQHYLNEHARVKNQLAGNHLPWINQLRQHALEQFAAAGFPTHKTEDWKYTNVASQVRHDFKYTTAEKNNSLPDTGLNNLDSYQLVFINGVFSAELSQLDAIPAKITISSLADALQQHPQTLRSHLGQYADIKSSGFTGLNTAFINDGVYIHLTEKTQLSKPIQLLFIATNCAESPIIPIRNLIVADKNTRATIIENYISMDGDKHFTSTLTEIVLDDGADIQHYKLLQENSRAFHIGTVQVRQNKNSNFTSHSFALGGALVRSDTNVQLAEKHAHCTLNGLYVLNAQQHVDHHTAIEHCTIQGTSQQNYKGVIADEARAVFNGKIVVQQNAQKTDAKQSNKNLLLSDKAEVNSKPQLEIFADDVKCAHGAAIGQLDENALFYLRSRGMDAGSARTMLVHAFARELIERVDLMPLRHYLEENIQQKLAALS